LRFFDSIADRIVSDIQPRTVMDVGCAMGFLVESLRRRGVEAFGIDVSEYAIAQVSADLRPYCRLGRATDPLERKYELVVCIEVLEHLSTREAEQAVENFCTHSEGVLFSSTPFDYGEATHLNVRPPEYWAELFARHGFFRDVDFDASFLTPWAIRFRPRSEPVHQLVRDYERKYWPLWKENWDLRSAAVQMRAEMRGQLAEKDQQINEAHHQIEEIRHSDTWRLAMRFQGIQTTLAPNGTLRHRLLQRIVRKLY
jgi:hypothetical protein